MKIEKMKVLKFGGTSVGSVERIKHVARLICSEEPKVVVLSAMSGTTNALAAIAGQLSGNDVAGALASVAELEGRYADVSDRLYRSEGSRAKAKAHISESFALLRRIAGEPFTSAAEKVVLAQGELIVTRLMYLYLKEEGVNAALLPATDFMRTDRYGEPDMRFIRRNVRKALNEYPFTRLFITQGYICRNAAGEIDNLRRGGSDYSTSLIGAALGASEIQIWTDIDGLHNNDPRVVHRTTPVRRLTFDEASKLAHFGAKILHPTCILPAKQKNIPVRLLNTMDPEAPGTLISDTADTGRIKAVAAKDDVTYVKIRSTYKVPSYRFLNKVFGIFDRLHTPIDLMVTSDVEISLSVDSRERLPQIVEALSPYADVTVEDDMVIVCVVGDLKWYNVGFETRIIGALKDIPVRMISYGDNCDLSLVMHRDDKKQALEALNNCVFH